MIWVRGVEYGTAAVGWTLTAVAVALVGALAWLLWDALRGRWRP
ncbi:hypothetical protein [Micromonospora sp. CB01531]|nr:hypothetical protein [Micromonospora sp. CB01531]